MNYLEKNKFIIVFNKGTNHQLLWRIDDSSHTILGKPKILSPLARLTFISKYVVLIFLAEVHIGFLWFLSTAWTWLNPRNIMDKKASVFGLRKLTLNHFYESFIDLDKNCRDLRKLMYIIRWKLYYCYYFTILFSMVWTKRFDTVLHFVYLYQLEF